MKIERGYVIFTAMEIKAYEQMAMGLRTRALHVSMSLGAGNAEAEDVARGDVEAMADAERTP